MQDSSLKRQEEIESKASSWSAPTGVLGELMEASRIRAQSAWRELSALKDVCGDMPLPPSFSAALRGDRVAVIAEIKRASPSKGQIAPELDSVSQALEYSRGGASAISVLTEPERFGGSIEDLSRVTQAVGIPVLRKDFVCSPVQIWEARAAGASAVLLIVRGLEPTHFQTLFEEARIAGLDVLTEVRDMEELRFAVSVGADIVGINNRNLETLVIDPKNAPALIPHVPPSCIAVAESGMAKAEDAFDSVSVGADALLVGSAVSAAEDPAAAVAEFASLKRSRR